MYVYGGKFFFKDLIYIIYDKLYLNISWFILSYIIVINEFYLFLYINKIFIGELEGIFFINSVVDIVYGFLLL